MVDPRKRLRVIPAMPRRSQGVGSVRSAAEQRFRSLALAALDKQQQERGKLARVLHDEVAQILSGAGLQLDILRMDLAATFPRIASRTEEIQELLDRAVRQIRELSYKLNPDIVARAGFQPALDLLVGRYQKIFSGSVRLSYDSSVRLPTDAAIAMEKIAEEAIDNAVRHGRCDRIEMIVKSTRNGPALQVRDNGSGFDCDLERNSPRGLGLLMMEYWASKAGLRLSINGKAVKGATITITAVEPKDGE